MSAEGEFSLKFNVDMLSPSDTSTLDYESIMKFSVMSAIDKSTKDAVYIQNPESRRRLKEKKVKKPTKRRNLDWITAKPKHDINWHGEQPFHPEGEEYAS
jgi:hypothetical protein